MRKLVQPACAFAFALSVIVALLALSSESPQRTLVAFFAKPLSSWWYAGNLLNVAGLLILAGTGSAFALRAGAFNLGGEAQLYASALVAAVILAPTGGPAGLAAEGFPRIAFALASAVATGALIAFIPGVLKASLRVSELITSFLLSAAVTPVLDWLISGPLRDPEQNLLATRAIDPAFRIPPIAAPALFNASFFVAVGIAVCGALFLGKTSPGYRIRISGTAPEFARYSGFSVKGATIAGMTVSGALHGLAGFFAVAGTWYMCHSGLTSGMGWGALACALMARANPLAVIPAAILYSWVETATDAASLSARFSFDSSALVQAVIFLVISVQTLGIPFLREKRRRP